MNLTSESSSLPSVALLTNGEAVCSRLIRGVSGTMRSALFCVLSLTTVASIACPQVEDIISTESKPLSPAIASGITKDMSVAEILTRLGPAARDVGSGLYVLQWDLTDGRVFFVSTPDVCGKPMGFGYVEQVPNKTIEPTR